MNVMSMQDAFLVACLIVGVGAIGLTLFALNIRRRHEHEQHVGQGT